MKTFLNNYKEVIGNYNKRKEANTSSDSNKHTSAGGKFVKSDEFCSTFVTSHESNRDGCINENCNYANEDNQINNNNDKIYDLNINTNAIDPLTLPVAIPILRDLPENSDIDFQIENSLEGKVGNNSEKFNDKDVASYKYINDNHNYHDNNKEKDFHRNSHKKNENVVAYFNHNSTKSKSKDNTKYIDNTKNETPNLKQVDIKDLILTKSSLTPTSYLSKTKGSKLNSSKPNQIKYKPTSFKNSIGIGIPIGTGIGTDIGKKNNLPQKKGQTEIKEIKYNESTHETHPSTHTNTQNYSTTYKST